MKAVHTVKIHSSGRGNRKRNSIIASLGLVAILCQSGCAVHYYDKQTGTEHLWGFGHMRTKVSPANEHVRSLVTGVQTVGVGIGIGQEDYSIAVGMSERLRLTVADDTAVRLDWPDHDFFKVQVGTRLDSISMAGTNSPSNQETTPTQNKP